MEKTVDVDRKELQKRQAVFTKLRKTVLVKIFAMGVIEGLPKKERNEKTIDARHQIDAKLRRLDFKAYREKGDTGFCLFNKEEGVTTLNIITQLYDLGLKYVGGHWQMTEKKGPVNTLEFSSEGKPVAIPSHIFRLLEMRFNHCTIWCNLRYAIGNSSGQYRLDTINLAKGKFSAEPTRVLVIDGNTYRLK